MNERRASFYFNRRVGFFSSLLSRNPLKIRPVLKPMTHRFLKLAVTVILVVVWAAFSQAQKPARESDEVLTPVMTKGDLYPADADAKKEIDEALEKAVASRASYTPGDAIAHVHVALGAHDDAIHELERAGEERSSSLHFVGIAQEFAPLRSDKRFLLILKKIGLDPAKVFAAGAIR